MSSGLEARWTGRTALRGFTLLEVLVVVAIIGIVLTMATLNVGGDRRGDALREESRRFAALVQLADEQAILRSEEWGVHLDAEGYGFLVLDGERWVPVGDPVFRERRFDEGTWVELELEGRPLVLSGGESDATREEGEEGEEDGAAADKPEILLLSSGEMSPFVAEFSAAGSPTRYRIRSTLLGEVEWSAVE